jgi:hypothetical protein
MAVKTCSSDEYKAVGFSPKRRCRRVLPRIEDPDAAAVAYEGLHYHGGIGISQLPRHSRQSLRSDDRRGETSLASAD